MVSTKLLMMVVALMTIDTVTSHGRLVLPAGRSSAWRYGFGTPHNYNDNELNCGGFNNQWGIFGGKCGVCGDPYQGPYDNEAGGKFATGTIVEQYTAGDVIPVKVDITANHMGWMEFRLCVNNNPHQRVTESCFNQHLLPLADNSGTRYYLTDKGNRVYDIQVKLPSGISCEACVLQWKWHCGNSWGTDPDGTSGIGYGPQEEFYGCADIRIIANGAGMPPIWDDVDTDSGNSKPDDNTDTGSENNSPEDTDVNEPDKERLSCQPTAAWNLIPGMIDWCNNNCNLDPKSCPKSHCICQ